MNALDLIRAAESLRLAAYDDATGDPVPIGAICKGTLTIGYGETYDVSPGEIISQAEAERRLVLRGSIAAADALYAVGAQCWSELAQARRDALVDMAYQLGRFKLLGFHKLLWAIQQGRWKDAQTEALSSLWAKQVPSRAKRDATILLTGEYPANAAP